MRALVGLLLVGVMAGCHSGDSAARSATSPPVLVTQVPYNITGLLVPWVDRPLDAPVETTTTTPPNQPLCDPHALVVVDASEGAAGGSTYVNVTLKNTSSSWCTLDPIAAGSALDPGGHRVALALSTTSAEALHVAPSGRVVVVFATGDVCGVNRDQSPSLRLGSFHLSVRGVELAVTPLAVMACDPRFISYLQEYFPPARLPQPGTVEALTATIEPDYHVRCGVLEYVVDLRNPTNVNFPLDICATYTQSFGASDPDVFVKHRYELNCDTVHDIGPHATVRYAMRFALPPGARLGKLDWQFGAGSPATVREVRV